MPTQDRFLNSFELVAATPKDTDELLDLARHLNSVNLPADLSAVEGLLETSEASFSGSIKEPNKRRYIFLLRDLDQRRLVGTSSIVAQLGQPEAPYIYFDVLSEEKFSRDLDQHFHHTLLRLGFSYNGPTELAGLVVNPEYRGHPARLGLCVSYIRFLFIAAYKERFQRQLLAELLPPLEPDGTSHLWNALGRRFTAMSYRDADRLSHENKDFIRDLFPSGVVYASLFEPEAQRVIGKVGKQTLGVERMLRRIGFRYASRVDPFDGGPHFIAETHEVEPVIASKSGHVVSGRGESRSLVAQLSNSPPYLHARLVSAHRKDDEIVLSDEALKKLGLTPNDIAWLLPLP